MRWLAVLVLVAVLSISPGCCYLTAPGNQSSPNPAPTNQGANQAPVVDITLDVAQGPAPFSPRYTYLCYDPNNDLASCEIKIDGMSYAKGANQSDLFPPGFKQPDFYSNVTQQVGNHIIEIIGVDRAGLTSSKTATFTVLPPPRLTQSGWYGCNGKANPPCDALQQDYCDKFTPTDISVRKAAAEAIAKHPGAFSINQLLDIYDWVHANIFYQNVPVDLWPPYYPNETLFTKSGDCKNQAVLMASMVEAIGGTARILYIPDCRHAFAEVYVGDNASVNALDNAVWSHYESASGQQINWHTSTEANGSVENWFIFDTAGGWFPGNTIPACLNASQVFVLRDCNHPDTLNAPKVQGTEYGPNTVINDTQAIEPLWGYHYWIRPSGLPDTYSYCHYKVDVESLSGPVDWYVSNEAGYQAFNNHQSFSYYYGEEQVQGGAYEFNWNSGDLFYVLLRNSDDKKAITVRTQVVETCYRK